MNSKVAKASYIKGKNEKSLSSTIIKLREKLTI